MFSDIFVYRLMEVLKGLEEIPNPLPLQCLCLKSLLFPLVQEKQLLSLILLILLTTLLFSLPPPPLGLPSPTLAQSPTLPLTFPPFLMVLSSLHSPLTTLKACPCPHRPKMDDIPPLPFPTLLCPPPCCHRFQRVSEPFTHPASSVTVGHTMGVLENHLSLQQQAPRTLRRMLDCSAIICFCPIEVVLLVICSNTIYILLVLFWLSCGHVTSTIVYFVCVQYMLLFYDFFYLDLRLLLIHTLLFTFLHPHSILSVWSLNFLFHFNRILRHS